VDTNIVQKLMRLENYRFVNF